MKRALTATVLALTVGFFAGITGAYAHANLQERHAFAGTRYKATMTISHGCEGSATTSVRILIPKGVRRIKPMPKPGWKLKTVVKKLDKPYKYRDRVITEDVRELIWSGGLLPDNFFDQFVFRAILPKGFGKTLYFKTIQQCEKGLHRWIEIPEPGKSRRDYKEPAPYLILIRRP